MDENSKTEPCSSVGNAFKAEGFETKTLASNSVLLGRFLYTDHHIVQCIAGRKGVRL